MTVARVYRAGLTSGAPQTQARVYRAGLTSAAVSAGTTRARLYRAGLASIGAVQGPIVSAGNPQTVSSGQGFTLLGTDSDLDGVVASRGWSLNGTSLGNTARVDRLAPIVKVDTVLTFVYSATDNDGITTSVQTAVTVRAAVDFIVQGNDVLPAVWRLISATDETAAPVAGFGSSFGSSFGN